MSDECGRCGKYPCGCYEALKRVCHHMAYGDDSDETFDEYFRLQGLNLTQEQKKELKEQTFGE